MRPALLEVLMWTALTGCVTDLSTLDADKDGLTADVDCDDSDASPEASEPQTWYADADQDGFFGTEVTVEACSMPDGFGTGPLDCDDLDAMNNPDAVEVCDGVDNDCDEAIDDDDDSLDTSTRSEWYADSDGDGYGVDTDTVTACVAPSGYADLSGDCDDTDETLNPDTIWYADQDGDTYGSDSITTVACEQPEDHTAEAGDCDDLEAAVNPDAVEVCDGIDNDCDEAIDDDDDSVDSSTFNDWYADLDADGYGDPDTTVVSCDAPSNYVDDDGDCDDTSEEVNPGQVEVCNNDIDDDCSGDAPECGVTGDYDTTTADILVSSSTSGDYTGAEVTSGDYDGDGVRDLVVSSYYADGGAGTGSGTAGVFLGPLTDDADISSADATFNGEDTYDYAGKFMESGDIDGDGYDDLLLSAYAADDGASGSGTLYVIYGSTGWSGSLDLDSTATARIEGSSSSDYLGESLALGDMDGDGYAEIVHGISSYDYSSSWSGEGAVGIWPGDSTRYAGTYEGDDAPLLIVGGDSYDYLGDDRSLGMVDANGDGLMDLLIGARGDDETGSAAGALYLVYGATTAVTGTYEATDVASVTYYGAAAGDDLGVAVQGVGDVNGDGYDDLAVGAEDVDDGSSYSVGAVYLIHGTTSATSGNTVDTEAAATILGTTSYDYLGGDDVAGGDFNHDGYDDLVVGSVSVDPNGNASAGAAYVMSGPFTGSMYVTESDATIVGSAESDYAAKSLHASDVDDDGVDDLIVGALGAEEALILLGGSM